jgi:predicted nucleic-acid-binding protein
LISLDTNALVRIIIEDDKKQAKIVEKTITLAEKKSVPILILSEVIVETVWVLESVYQCTRQEIYQFLETLIFTPVFTFVDSQVIRRATHEYKKGGDFADLLIVFQAKEHHAGKLISFDQKFQKNFPEFVFEKIGESYF